MAWPSPQPGLVVRYSYLWRREAEAGRDEGIKDQPRAVVVAVQTEAGSRRVYVLPITRSPPNPGDDGIELPRSTKRRLGLGEERSWIIVSEANVFTWPGPDLRVLSDRGPDSVAYGFLPPRFFRLVRDRFLARGRERRIGMIRRTE